MARLHALLGRTELQATGSVLFLILVTWPLWTHHRPSTTLMFIFAVWLVFTAFSIATMALGREPVDTAIDDVEEEEGLP